MSEPSQKPPMGRRLRVLLFASLALNLVIVSVVAGMVARGGPPPRVQHRGGDPVMPYTRAFDETQRKDLGRALRRANLPKPGEARRADLVESYRDALGVLREDPFDRARFDAAVERQKELAERRRNNGQQVLSDYLEAMTPEQRADYAIRLEQEIESLSTRRKRWRKD